MNYTAGFEVQTTAYGDVFIGVPEWLKEASIVHSVTTFNSGGCTASSSSKSSKSQPKCDANEQVRLLVNRYVRFFPSARKTLL